jgi:hypothetical protein
VARAKPETHLAATIQLLAAEGAPGPEKKRQCRARSYFWRWPRGAKQAQPHIGLPLGKSRQGVAFILAVVQCAVD